MIQWHGAPPTHLSIPQLEAAGVRHAFTTRHHGSFQPVSAPGGAFGSGGGPALAALGVAPATVRVLRQVHGAEWLRADPTGPTVVGTADALVTLTPGLPLAVFTADCLAVVLVEPDRRVLAVVHAGWRGTVAGILGRLVGGLAAELGVQPARLRVGIGPSIGPCCYEVDGPVVEPLRGAFSEAPRWIRPAGPGRWWLDLWQANTDQLVAAGVPAGAVTNPRLCTSCRRDLFFSYRREGPGRRLATLAVLE
ncbi:MAG TPA: polyphenol oxidase family protein [Methylomirabilota bacterium]|nr:polyphenol oxidase family protein [Methylomirabilota bacterium]